MTISHLFFENLDVHCAQLVQPKESVVFRTLHQSTVRSHHLRLCNGHVRVVLVHGRRNHTKDGQRQRGG